MEQLIASLKGGADRLEVSPARWVGFLNWLESDVGPQMMRGMRENEPKREKFDSTSSYTTAHEAWQRSYAEMFSRFEAFSQGRAAMGLNDPKYCRMFLSMITSLSTVSTDAARFFAGDGAPKVEIDPDRPATTDP